MLLTRFQASLAAPSIPALFPNFASNNLRFVREVGKTRCSISYKVASRKKGMLPLIPPPITIASGVNI